MRATNSASLAATFAIDASAVLSPLREASKGLTSRRASYVVPCTTGTSRSPARSAESSLSANYGNKSCNREFLDQKNYGADYIGLSSSHSNCVSIPNRISPQYGCADRIPRISIILSMPPGFSACCWIRLSTLPDGHRNLLWEMPCRSNRGPSA
jgi:hypothetical protein